MTLDTLRDYCLTKPGVTESLPFDDVTLVFKVATKMFALTSLDTHPVAVSLKCEPERAVQLRDAYACVQPGFHLNKTHWNTVVLDGSVRDAEVYDWIDHSYELVRQGLPKGVRESLNATN